MDSKYIIGPNGELYHWGIRGMRWGVRRYQNKDGSLTKAGLKRYAEETNKLKAREQIIKRQERNKAKIEKLAAKKSELDAREEALKNPKNNSSNKKSGGNSEKKTSIKDMSNEELHGLISRLTLEKSYYDAQRNLAAVTPQKQSAGKKFVDGLMNDVVVPAAKNVGKSWLENTLRDKLGLNEADPIKKLESKYKTLDLQQKIKRLESRDPDDELSWDERLKKQQYEQNEYTNARKRKQDAKEDAAAAAQNSSSDNGNKSSRPPAPENNKSTSTTSRPPAPENKKNTASSSNKSTSSRHDYGSDAYEKRVDAALAKIDNKGWDIYNKSTKTTSSNDYGSKAYEQRVDKLLSDMDAKGWDLYNSSKDRT